MNQNAPIPPLTHRAYRWPVLIAAGGFVALGFATAAFPIYAMLTSDPAPGDPDWFPAVGALVGGGFWVVVAIGLFWWAARKARPIIHGPQDRFRYTTPLSILFIVGGVFVLARNVWWLMALPTETWTSFEGSSAMLLISSTTLFAVPVLWAARLRLAGSGFGGPATIAAVAFLTLAYWPLALVTLVVYLFVRTKEGPVVEA